MDKRKNYYITLDTETAMPLDNPLVYDIGFIVHDKQGTIYERHSYIVQEIFFKQEIMATAYYKDKIDSYVDDINNGTRIIKKFNDIRKILLSLYNEYNCKAIISYNARFDYKALNNTTQYLNGYKYYYPKNVEIYDSLKMVNDTLAKRNTYKRFCQENGYLTNHKTPRPQVKAEIVYRYITRDLNFVESHTGHEDCEIEVVIFTKCMQQHKKMRKKLWD